MQTIYHFTSCLLTLYLLQNTQHTFAADVLAPSSPEQLAGKKTGGAASTSRAGLHSGKVSAPDLSPAKQAEHSDTLVIRNWIEDDLRKEPQQVKAISIKSDRITPEDAKKLLPFTFVEKLSFPAQGTIHPQTIEAMTPLLEHVREIHAPLCGITDDILKILISKATMLEVLDLQENRSISNKSVQALLPIATRLRSLNLSGSGITDDIVDELKSFTKLEYLNVERTYVTRQKAQALTVTITSLKEKGALLTNRAH
jgi:hypothetical protein